MKKLNILVSLFITLLLIIACTTNRKSGNPSVDSRLRHEMVEEISNMKSLLPMQIPNSPLTIVDASVDCDLIEFVAALPNSLFEDGVAFGSDVANSDKNVARMLNNVNQEFVNKFLKAGFGIRYVYTSAETGDTLMKIEADRAKLERVKKGISSGEIVPFTTLEIFQMEIDNYEFPCEIDDGVWLTDGYIKGNTVYYISVIESDITSDDLSYSDVLEMKQGILEEIKKSLVSVHKKEMEQKGIRIIYVYNNNNGDEFARVEITSDDI